MAHFVEETNLSSWALRIEGNMIHGTRIYDTPRSSLDIKAG